MPFHGYDVELVGVPRPNSGPGPQGRCPKMSIEFLLPILKKAESKAELKSLDVDSLLIEYIQVDKTPKMQRRTYRAHG